MHEEASSLVEYALDHYEDRIVIDAGVPTPVVAAYAAGFYRHRQRRWRALARLLRAADLAEAEQAGTASRSGTTQATADDSLVRPISA